MIVRNSYEEIQELVDYPGRPSRIYVIDDTGKLEDKISYSIRQVTFAGIFGGVVGILTGMASLYLTDSYQDLFILPSLMGFLSGGLKALEAGNMYDKKLQK